MGPGCRAALGAPALEDLRGGASGEQDASEPRAGASAASSPARLAPPEFSERNFPPLSLMGGPAGGRSGPAVGVEADRVGLVGRPLGPSFGLSFAEQVARVPPEPCGLQAVAVRRQVGPAQAYKPVQG